MDTINDRIMGYTLLIMLVLGGFAGMTYSYYYDNQKNMVDHGLEECTQFPGTRITLTIWVKDCKTYMLTYNKIKEK